MISSKACHLRFGIFSLGLSRSSRLKALFFTRIVEGDLPIVLSTSAAYLFSVVSFVYILHGNPSSKGEFFETRTPPLVTLIMVGRYVRAKLPSKIPIAIANMIQTVRKRFNQPRPLIADTLSGSIVSSIFCLLTSVGGL